MYTWQQSVLPDLAKSKKIFPRRLDWFQNNRTQPLKLHLKFKLQTFLKNNSNNLKRTITTEKPVYHRVGSAHANFRVSFSFVTYLWNRLFVWEQFRRRRSAHSSLKPPSGERRARVQGGGRTSVASITEQNSLQLGLAVGWLVG